MGKCVSKQPVAGLNEFGSSPYLAICNEDDIIYINVGQSESKKSSKKAAAAAGLETKGTAMSFGFMHKHKIHHASSKGTSASNGGVGGDGTGLPGPGTGTVKKTTAGTNGNHPYGAGDALEMEKATERDNATVISNPGVDGIFSDKNGNMGLVSDDKSSATGRSTPRLQPPKKDSHGAPYRNNRFGFRSTNVVRPASVGLQPKTIADCDKQHSNNNHNNNNNIHTTNNNNVYITDKRRSKSASAAASARTTFTPVHQQAPSSGQQDRHFGALPKPQPKYHQSSAANGSAPKITPSEPSSSSAGAPTTAKGTAASMQQVMTKCDQPEHKNTQHNPPPSSASAQFGNGSVDEHRSQSSVNNANGQRQSVSFGGHQQQHVAANSLTKTAQEASSSVAAKFTLHSSSLPKPQYPVPISLPSVSAPSHYAMDAKGAKQAVNISRKGTLQGQRDQSGDRLLDEDANEDSSSNIRMPRQRLRNLEMVLNGRHKFEVRDLENLTAEPIVALPLPKLPSAFSTNGQQQQPVPLSGLIRSSELPRQLSDDIDINDNRYESEQNLDAEHTLERKDSITSSDVESLEEEKLMRDNNSSEKSLKGALIKDLAESHCSKTSSPGSSRASWCNAGETMAAKECSSLSLSSSDEDNLIRRAAAAAANNRKREEEDISSITVTVGNPSLLSSLSAAIPMDMSTNLDSISEAQNSFTEQDLNTMSDEPDNMFRTEETKFAEMAAAVGDAILLDDETSPTDSLVSSCTESDDARKNRKKVAEAKLEKEKEKDIDEISPELEELTSPVTPGTPTHASNSLSLSDNGRDFLIDDEIADQPALLFDEPAHNESSMIDLASIHLNLHEDTPTLKDSISSANIINNNNNRSASRSGAPVPKPRKIMSDVYESPAPIRKNRSRLSRAESLDTLSPCDSIKSDDFMLDFNSSMDSINGPPRSNASGSASGLHSMDELQLWSELENKGGQLMHEWSKLLRSQRNSNNNTSRESITSQLPARATRLLTRRLQNNATPTNCGSDSPRSMDSLPRRTAALSAAYKTVTLNQFNNNNGGGGGMTDSASTVSNSAEDLTLLDKSLRNSMLQDVVHFKKQLVRLRRILQETDTLNPFENNNGQFFTTATATNGTGNLVEGAATGGGGGPSSVDSKQQENTLIKESGVVALALLEDQRQELADLRRQVVYLQGEITAKDRTIRQQQNLIEKYEAEREKAGAATNGGEAADKQTIDTISTATQTERLRPLSFGGPEGLASRSEPSSPFHGPAVRNGLRSPATNHHHHHHTHHNGSSSPSATSLALATTNSASPQRPTAFNLKPKTQISSVYTQLSSIKHSTQNGGTMPTNGSTTTTMATMAHHRRSSLSASNGNLCSSTVATCNGGSSPNKTVRTTHIGNVLTSSKLNQNGSNSSMPGSPTPPVNGAKLLKTSIRTQSSPSATPRSHPATPKRTSAIKPPSCFGTGGTFPDSPSLKSKSAPATPIVERVPVQIVIDAVDEDVAKDIQTNNGHNGDEDNVAGEDKEHVAETEKDAIHNKINSLKLANGLTGCNDSSCKESSLVN